VDAAILQITTGVAHFLSIDRIVLLIGCLKSFICYDRRLSIPLNPP
jgi:hypothetical protein